MHTFIVIGNMGWKDFSKAGCLVHLTKSTVYGIIVIIFLSTNVIRWCMAVNGDDTFGVMLIYKLMNMTWGLETLGHCIGFFIASLSYKRLPEFLAEWDKLRLQCVNNATSLKKQTDICTAVTWLLAGLNIAFCIYLTFGTHVQDLMLYPLSIDDDPSTILAMKIINVVVQSYLILAWITPSALLFMVAKFLAWEFSHSTAKIRELRDKCNTTCLERIRKHHQKLCNLVDHADDIFSMQISSIGRVFRSPLWRVEENGGPSASGRHLWWPHFRFPQMRSPKMATGSGRAAIFLHPPQQGSKNAPQVLDDVISGAAILDSRWRRWKWRLEDVETPVKTSYRRLPHPWVL